MNLENLDSFAQDFQRHLDSLPWDEFFDDVGNILVDAVITNFDPDVQGAYFQKGQAWEPLKPSTILDRVRKGFNATDILVRSGGDAGLKGSISYEVGNENITLKAGVPYAVHLHYGTEFMPPRPIFPLEEFGLPPDLLEEIQNTLYLFLGYQL